MIIAALIALAVASQALSALFGRAPSNLFDLNSEASVANWYSAAAIFFAAALLMMICVGEGERGSRFAGHWALLSGVFTLLSLDEAASLHERMGKAMANYRLVRDVDLLFYPWVAAGAIAVVVLGLAYLRFLAALPKRTRCLFVAAAGLYIGGALIMEVVGGLFVQAHGVDSWQALAGVVVEEGCEMTGIALFIYALLSYMEASFQREIRLIIGK